MSLTLDGRSRRVWTTARTVDEALRQFGVRADGAYLSASRSEPIGRHGLDLDVRTERTLTFLVDGRERTIRTNAATVGEAVREAGIALHGQDTTSVDPDTFPREGQTVSVMRISGTEEVHEEPIPYATERHEDGSLFRGTTMVDTPGRAGVRRVTYAYRTVNGVKQKPRRIAEELVSEPVRQVVRVGTKALPTSVAADGLNWGGLAACEAAWPPQRGRRLRHLRRPLPVRRRHLARHRRLRPPPGRPRRRADLPREEALRDEGATPWPVCGRRLYR